jgi:hypothetical protein
MNCTSGSGIERALKCPASTVLPRDSNTGPAAEGGRAIHTFLEAVSAVGRDAAIEMISASHGADVRDVCEAIDTDSLPTDLAHEVAFVFDIDKGTAVELGRGGEFRYPDLGTYQIPCRLDIVGASSRAVFVGDYKSGHGEVTPAKRNGQIGFGALCASRAYGRDEAVVEIIRPGHTGSKAYRDSAELDAFDLDGLAGRLRRFRDRRERLLEQQAAGHSLTVHEGDHCRYCPSYRFCGAKAALAVRLGTGEELREQSAELTRETAAHVYARAKAARELLDRIFAAIYGMAKQEPLALGNGQMLGEVTKPGNEKLDGDAVFEVMSRLHNEEIAGAAIKRTASKVGIETALRGHVPKLAPAVREIVEHVRKAGGSERKPSITITEYAAPPEASPFIDVEFSDGATAH